MRIVALLIALAGFAWGETWLSPAEVREQRDGFEERCPTRADFSELLLRSNNTKVGFFHGATASFPGLFSRDSLLRVSASPRTCFFGDSVVRELAEAHRRLFPAAPVVYKSTACNVLDDVRQEAKIQEIARNDCDVFVWGGLGPHCLKRNAAAGATPSADPVADGERRAAKTLAALGRLADATPSTLVVFMGSPTVEGEIMLLPPTKGNAGFFFDFSLSWLDALSERRLFRAAGGAPANVRLFDTVRVHERCPGARCDGMHMANKAWGACTPNDAYLDWAWVDLWHSEGGLLDALAVRGLAPADSGARVARGAPAQPAELYCHPGHGNENFACGTRADYTWTTPLNVLGVAETAVSQTTP